MKIQPDVGGRFRIGAPPDRTREAAASLGTLPYTYSFEIVGVWDESLAEVVVSCAGGPPGAPVSYTVTMKPHDSHVRVVEEKQP